MVLEICYSVGPKSKDSKRDLCTRIVPARPESRATTANERIDVVGNGGEGGCRRTQHQHQQEREHRNRQHLFSPGQTIFQLNEEEEPYLRCMYISC